MKNDSELLASLAVPVRRALFAYVAASGHPVSRDDAAAAVEVSRQVASYHLDRLADDGLLEVEFRRLTGRVGPGAGRPSKLYRRSDLTLELSIPPRRYELAARILLRAVGKAGVDPALLAEVAHGLGVEIGKGGLEAGLVDTGYEPTRGDDETRFRNCPFHVLKDDDLETMCGINLALVEGMVEGSGSNLVATLAPEPGYCCVRLGTGL